MENFKKIYFFQCFFGMAYAMTLDLCRNGRAVFGEILREGGPHGCLGFILELCSYLSSILSNDDVIIWKISKKYIFFNVFLVWPMQ